MRVGFCLTLLLFLKCSPKDDFSTSLQGHHWYVNAEHWTTEKSATLTADSTSHYDWEIEFFPNHRMLYASTFPHKFIDAKGITHLKGERFTDTLYSYEIKNNILKISKGEEIYFLAFQKKGDNAWLIQPSLEKDFEK